MDTLSRPGNLIFPENVRYRNALDQAGGRCVRQPSGHCVYYTREGRRFLYTDPDGQALHECEWEVRPDGSTHLRRARVWLDWDQWVGLTPCGLVNETVLDLSKKPGWQGLRPDDLREMAARAMPAPIEDVRLFYGDEDLTISPRGQATIRHKKDVLSILPDGTFDRPIFMACMGAMHWAAIDFLPVVELFQSLLPGTGSAVLELIRGLCDDQQAPTSPQRLRYRGIPPYPSLGAFRLFSQFFVPNAPGGQDPQTVFLDPARTMTVLWAPAEHPPLRFRDAAAQTCVTVKDGQVQKVTRAHDACGLSYFPASSSLVAHNRQVAVEAGHLLLFDGPQRLEIPLSPQWGVTKEHHAVPPHQSGWESLLVPPLRPVSPRDAFGAVSLYPPDDTEIGEAASQPFVGDYLEDLGEEDPTIRRWRMRAERIAIDGFDAAIPSLMQLDRPRRYRIVYRWPAIAQKQAQSVWNYLAQMGRLAWAEEIRFHAETAGTADQPLAYDGWYCWIPFHEWDRQDLLAQRLSAGRERLTVSGLAFVVGPPNFSELAQEGGWSLQSILPVAELPTFHMHRQVLPRARLKSGLTAYQLRRL